MASRYVTGAGGGGEAIMGEWRRRRMRLGERIRSVELDVGRPGSVSAGVGRGLGASYAGSACRPRWRG